MHPTNLIRYKFVVRIKSKAPLQRLSLEVEFTGLVSNPQHTTALEDSLNWPRSL